VLNINWVGDVGQTEMHTAESAAPEHSAFVFQMPVEKIRIYDFHLLVE
jgi:hypothetical protein